MEHITIPMEHITIPPHTVQGLPWVVEGDWRGLHVGRYAISPMVGATEIEWYFPGARDIVARPSAEADGKQSDRSKDY